MSHHNYHHKYLREDEMLSYFHSLLDNESEGENIFSDDELSDNADDVEYIPHQLDKSKLLESDVGDNTMIEEPVQEQANDCAVAEPHDPVPCKRGGFNRGRQAPQEINFPAVGSNESAVDGTMWTRIEPGNIPGRRGHHNVLTERPGPTDYTKKLIMSGNHASAWQLLMDANIPQNIKKYTEIRGRQDLQDNSWTIELDQLEAAIAILYARGQYGGKNFHLKFLRSKVWGPPFFSRVMESNTFIEIMRVLRFADKHTHDERLKTDGFAVDTRIWSPFVHNCKLSYDLGTVITIDEQLYPCKARCCFTQYMSNKPDKFGLKFWLAADSETKFMVNGFPYLGKHDEQPSNMSVPEHVVTRLMQPFTSKGRNVTCDKFFTSKNLDQLKLKNTTMVGTLKKSRREVPHAKSTVGSLYDTILYRSDDTTITSYQGRMSFC